ncbi:MAG: ABC transporter ATP-binding protein [Candidatus Omnitrophica bacterium]|nr:ABC transporter ATP-binding protein [Candidatus Omnitrophota bacterium]MCM8777367.1 ABC transporter ATP-binding protein [Candidatus Omnitrophota bacterium]
MEKVLDVRELKVALRRDVHRSETEILKGVEFSIGKKESLALVGESGSGKTLTAMTVMGLLPENMSVKKGEVLLCGRDILKMSQQELRDVRGVKAGMIFQEPSSYLNPVFTAGNQIFEAIKDTSLSVKEKKKRCIDVLKDVGFTEDIYYRYPHQLSGGQQQRVMIAIALVNNPSLLIADEPTTALDVTTAAGIIELLKILMERYGLSLLFITHDISLVSNFVDKIAVMYAGRIVEITDAKMTMDMPLHPYTEKLIACLPERYNSGEKIKTIEGSVPDFHNLPSGCPFHPRCPYVMEICRKSEPPVVKKYGILVRCFKYGMSMET